MAADPAIQMKAERIVEQQRQREMAERELTRLKAEFEQGVPPIYQMEADRRIIIHLIRKYEIDIYGEPRTPLPTRHNP